MTDIYDPFAAEMRRAENCIARNRDKTLKWVIQYYMIRPEIAQALLKNHVDGEEEGKIVETSVLRRQKRANQYIVLESWLDANIGGLFSPKQIGRATGFSTPTIRKHIKDNVGRYKFVRTGRYEIRDPQADRKQEKGKKK
jgi:hypothetical protein